MIIVCCHLVDGFLLVPSMDGVLDFIDTNDMTLMNRQEHTKVTDIAWDPTGRYVVSSVSYWTEKVKSAHFLFVRGSSVTVMSYYLHR